jgi:diguanylate cyclase (GGDEF)-like protein
MANQNRKNEAQDLSAILKSDLFSELLPGEARIIVERTKILLVRKGGLLFSPAEKAEHFYLLLGGNVRVFKQNEGGAASLPAASLPAAGLPAANLPREDEIARFAPGDIIGDFDFARAADYDAYAEALEDSTLLMFPEFGLTMEEFALEEPHIISRILLNSAAMVTGRIKATRKLLFESVYWVQELHRKVYEDPGTGLWKQIFLTEEINRVLERPMALIMLKPDRFKILVDSLGHDAGDEAMIKIAAVLKGITRKLNKGWALRFKSNETGILLNKCDAAEAESVAIVLAKAIAALPHVPLGKENFYFTGTIAWGVWPADDKSWDSLFEGTYKLMMNTWKDGGNEVVRYKKENVV